jgi:hypothetical protein
VLLASEAPLPELADQVVHLRLQTWHKVLLPGEPPEPWGVLMCVRRTDAQPDYVARLTPTCDPPFALALDVGGEMSLIFQPIVYRQLESESAVGLPSPPYSGERGRG